jgi:PAS domain S-box-containing protein
MKNADRANLLPDLLRVLIVEDSPSDAQLMASVLERGGFRVQFDVADSADTFRECLERAEYDVILADFNLRSWTAFDAVEIVRRSGEDIPLVVVTGAVGEEAAAESLKQGAADYVLKDRPSRLPSAVQRVLEEKRLRTENQRAFGAIAQLATIVESSDDAIIGKTLEGVITSWNKGAEELYGYAAAEVVGRPVSILIPFDRSEELAAILARLRRGERVEHFESVRVRKNGSLVDVSLSMFPLIGSGGDVIGAASIARDITDRNRAEMELHRVNRALRTVTECNQVIVRATDESHLLEDICGILVGEGGYRMAWVGYGEDDEGKSVRPVAHAGFDEGYLQAANITWADTERGRGPTGTAIRTGKTIIARNIQTEPSLAPWQADQLKRGYASSIALPILVNDKVLGALTIYAEEPDVFSSEETQLLMGLSNDLAFGIQALRTSAERKRAEESLKEEKHLLHTLLDNLPDAIYFKDRASRFTRVNLALAKKVDLDRPAQVAGKTDFDIFTAEHAEEAYRDEQEIIRTGQAVVGKEEKETWPDGNVTWASTTKMPLRDANCNTIGTFGISRDITERKDAEEALRESEERFRATFEDSGIGMALVDLQGHPIKSNLELQQMLGYSEEELSRMAFTDYTHPDDRDLDWRLFSELVAGKRAKYETEKRFLKKGGDLVWGLLTASLVKDRYGSPVCAVGMVQDITERKLAEVRIRESEEKFRKAFMTGADAFYIGTLHEGLILEVNDRFEEVFGYSREEAIGKTSIQLELYADPADRASLVSEVESTGCVRNMELRARRKSGEIFPLLISVNLLQESGEQLILGAIRDITERVRAEEALRQSEAALKEALLAAQMGVWEWTAETDTVIWDENLYRIAGRDPKLPVPTYMQHQQFYAPESWERLKAAVENALTTGTPYELDLEMVRPDGSKRCVIARGEPLCDANGRITRRRGTVQDITERKRMEDALRRANDYNRSLLEASLDPLVTIAPDGKIADVNSATENITGRTRDELIGTDFSDYFTDPEKARAGYQKVFREGLVRDYELEIRHRDGCAIPVLYNAAVYRDQAGTIIGVFAAARDITQRKRTEAELADRLRFETLLADLSARFVHLPAEQIDGEIKDAQRRVCQSLALDACSLWQVMPENPSFIPLTHIYRPSEGAPIPEGINAGQYLPWSTQQIRAGKVIVASSLEELPAEAVRDRQTFGLFGIQSVLVLGLSVGGGPIVGGLAFSTRTPCAWPDELVKRLHVVAELFCSALARQRSESALRDSEERFRSLVENATVGIYRTTPDGRILMANPTLVRMLGFKDFEELAARNLEEDGFEPDYARKLFRERMEKNGEIIGIEAAWTRQDGSAIFVRESARAIRSEDGKILYYDGIVEDITEKKRAEEALRLTQFSVEHASDAIFWMDPQGRLLYVNEAACRSLGWSREELLSLSIPDIDPLVTKDVWGANWEADKARGSVVLETQHKTKQGRVFPVEVTANYLEFGGKEYSFAFARDITERKRAEAEHVRLVTAIEQSAEAVMITTTSGEIEYVNPAFTRITGFTREEALGQNPRILKSGNQDPALYQELWATVLEGKTWHGELVNRRKDGSLYNEQMNIAPVRGEGGEVTHFIATKQDITARKELEQRFVQAQKMEAVGRLAGGVAHDFNNLLTVINGYAQILTQRSPAKDPRRGLFEEIQMAGERAASLTRQLLAFSRRQVMEPKVLDLSSVLANTEKMLRRLIGEDIELATKLQPGLGRVKVDPGQIEQVIMNLAVNARDAMPQGGKFIIETANVEVDEDYARSHKPMTPGKYVVVSVRDTGCGMDLATQAHIFEPFFTTKAKGKGTGLGLATVYGIVKQSGGFIWVYSEPGQGAAFKIYFPCVEEAAPAAQPAKARRPSKQTKVKETILVVEDEIGVRSLVCETLKSKGYKTLAAEGAAEALRIAKQHTKPIHLLLTDVVMPLTGGKELATRLATLHPESKVLCMSGYTDDAVVRHGILDGSTPLLQKPFLPNTLLLKVREVLRMKRGT